jgi:hypothetical protein
MLSTEGFFQTTMDHILSNKYDIYKKEQTEYIWTTVLSQIQHILEYIEPESSNQIVITRLLNQTFEYIHDNKEFLKMTDNGAFDIEEKLIEFLDITYYQHHALYYLEKLFDIYIHAKDYDENDEYIEYIVTTKGSIIYI